MGSEQKVEFPDIGSFTVSVPLSDELLESVHLLGIEFAHEKHQDFAAKLLRDHGISPEEIIEDPERVKRAEEIFRLENKNGETVAVCASKYYSWNLISNQICYDFDQEKETLSLAHFGDLVKESKATPDLVAEIAYNLVEPKYRGMGLGGKLFQLRMARISQIKTENPKVAFTMSRGAHIDSGEGTRILQYMLEKERQATGQKGDKIEIVGVSIPIPEIYQALGLDESFELNEVHKDSKPIVKLAKNNGLVFRGLFKDLSPIFSRTL